MLKIKVNSDTGRTKMRGENTSLTEFLMIIYATIHSYSEAKKVSYDSAKIHLMNKLLVFEKSQDSDENDNSEEKEKIIDDIKNILESLVENFAEESDD